MGVKIYGSIHTFEKKEYNNTKKIESILKKFLLENSFYSLNEFYNFT
jgi:hypothetical protein